MAKNKKSKSTPKKIVEDEILTNKDLLPQNILQIGSRDDEDKTIYIYQSVYKEIHDFTKDKTENESGGVLVGNVVDAFGKTNIIIKGFIEAKFCEATPTTLKFTHETWDYINDIREEQFENQVILGWIHTHPNFGIFLSEYDKFIHQNFFNEEFQTAYVVDPIQHIEGFYIWVNGNITKCKGFYIFDKTGVPIEDLEEDDVSIKGATSTSANSLTSKIVLAVLSVAVVVMAVIIVGMNGKLNTMQQQQTQALAAIQQNEFYYQQELSQLSEQVSSLMPTTEENTEAESKSDDETTQGNETTTMEATTEESTEATTEKTTTVEKVKEG